MSTARRVPEACASIKAGKWERSNFVGVELKGKTVAIIGLGKGEKLQLLSIASNNGSGIDGRKDSYRLRDDHRGVRSLCECLHCLFSKRGSARQPPGLPKTGRLCHGSYTASAVH